MLSAIVTLLLGLLAAATAQKKGGNGELRAQRRATRSAIHAWASSLAEDDYNATIWQRNWQQPQNFFEHYNGKLSDIFKAHNAKVNFALVGACDGTHDRTIKDRYFAFDHWRGAFVEPFTINYQDLVHAMADSGVSDRAHLIHGAATNECPEENIKMKRPTFEEKNKSSPHWMRREIGSIVPKEKLTNPATGGWVFEYTKCYTAHSILKSWETALLGSAAPKGYRVRPHVLKVDVEGHDFWVLMSFLGDDMPASALPLMVSFEAKSIKGHYDELKAQFIKRGYVVSHMANDGFALLRPTFKKSRGEGVEAEAVAVDPRQRLKGKGRGKRTAEQDDAQS